MLFQQQVGASAGIESLGQFASDDSLLLAVCGGVVLDLGLPNNAEQYSRAIGRHGGDRHKSCKQENAVGAGIGNPVKTLQKLTDLGNGTHERVSQIAPELVLHTKGKFLQALGAQIRKHAARLDGCSNPRGFCRQQLVGIDAHIARQRIPALGTSRFAGWIAAIPPDEKFVGVCRKGWGLGAVEVLKAIEDFGDRKL